MQTLTRSGPVKFDVPVVVELGPELEPFGNDRFAADLKKRATQMLEPLLQALQVPGQRSSRRLRPCGTSTGPRRAAALPAPPTTDGVVEYHATAATSGCQRGRCRR
jgi:hypothetical protein